MSFIVDRFSDVFPPCLYASLELLMDIFWIRITSFCYRLAHIQLVLNPEDREGILQFQDGIAIVS
jgi:hypothetical protein